MLRYLLLFCLIGNFSISLFAQTGCPGCVITIPDTLGMDTIYLSDAPDGQVGLPYDEDLSFRLPMTTNPVNAVDPETPAGLDIDEIRILGVVGLPVGLQWEASETVFPVMEQTDGCVKLCGTPLLPGLYEVQVVIEAHIFFLSQQTSVSFFIFIAPAETITEGFSIENNAACGTLTTEFINNIPSGGLDGFSYFWDMGNGNSTTMETPNPQTYSEPGDYEVNYQAIIDTAGFFLTQVEIIQTPCTDLFSQPDLKFDIFDPNGDHVYTAPITGNANLPILYDVLIPVGEGNYELHVIDDDGGLDGADDLCGIINFSRELSGNLSAGDLTVNIQLIHPIDTIRSSELVHVFTIPETPQLNIIEEMPFCDGGNVNLVVTNYENNLSWTADSLAIPSVSIDTLEVSENGEYAVFYTSENGCVSEAILETIEFIPLPNPFELQQDGNLIRIEDESQLPMNFSFAWFYEGNLIPSATDLLLCTEAEGLYTLEIIDTDTGCSTQTTIDGNYDAELFCSTSINELENADTWLVYPNPVVENMNFRGRLKRDVIVRLYNVLGQRVFERVVNQGEGQVNASFLTKGMYFFEIQVPNGEIVYQGSLIKA